MRITLNLDDDAHRLLKSYAKARSISLGKAASDLVRRGFNAPVELRLKNGFYSVELPPASPKVTSEHVKRLIEDEI